MTLTASAFVSHKLRSPRTRFQAPEARNGSVQQTNCNTTLQHAEVFARPINRAHQARPGRLYKAKLPLVTHPIPAAMATFSNLSSLGDHVEPDGDRLQATGLQSEVRGMCVLLSFVYTTERYSRSSYYDTLYKNGE